MLSEAILNLAVGALAGIVIYPSIKVRHEADICKPFKLDDRTYVDKRLILYLPLSGGVTGLSKCRVETHCEDGQDYRC